MPLETLLELDVEMLWYVTMRKRNTVEIFIHNIPFHTHQKNILKVIVNGNNYRYYNNRSVK